MTTPTPELRRIARNAAMMVSACVLFVLVTEFVRDSLWLDVEVCPPPNIFHHDPRPAMIERMRADPDSYRGIADLILDADMIRKNGDRDESRE